MSQQMFNATLEMSQNLENTPPTLTPLFTSNYVPEYANITMSQPNHANLLNEVLSLKNKLEDESKKNEERYNQMHTLLVKQDILLKRIAADCFPDTTDLKILPFKSMDEIISVEANLENFVKGELISYLKLSIAKMEVHKIHPILFTNDLLMEINWDGLKKKKSVKNFKFFNTYLYEAAKGKNGDYSNFEKAMRHGFKIAKNNIYKNNAKQNKVLNKTTT